MPITRRSRWSEEQTWCGKRSALLKPSVLPPIQSIPLSARKKVAANCVIGGYFSLTHPSDYFKVEMCRDRHKGSTCLRLARSTRFPASTVPSVVVPNEPWVAPALSSRVKNFRAAATATPMQRGYLCARRSRKALSPSRHTDRHFYLPDVRLFSSGNDV